MVAAAAVNPDNAETQVVEGGYLSLDAFEDSQLEVRKQGPLPEKTMPESRGENKKRKRDEERQGLRKGRAFTESKFQMKEKEEDNGKEEDDSKDDEATKYYERQEETQEGQEEEKCNHDQKTEELKEREEVQSRDVVDQEDDAIQSNEEEQDKRGTFQEHSIAQCCLVLKVDI